MVAWASPHAPKLKRLKDIFNDEPIIYAQDYNLIEYLTFAIADVAFLLPSKSTSCQEWCKYAKKKLDSLNDDKRYDANFGYLKSRWKLMLEVGERELAIEECLIFLENGNKELGYDMMTILSIPKIVGVDQDDNFVQGLEYAIKGNENFPGNIDFVRYIYRIIQACHDLDDSVFESRILKCKDLLQEKADFRGCSQLHSWLSLYQFENDQIESAFNNISQAVGYASRTVPPDLNTVITCRSDLEFIRLYKLRNDSIRVREAIDKLEELISFIRSSNNDSSTLPVAIFNQICAMLLGGESVQYALAILEGMLKESSVRELLSQKLSFLIICKWKDGAWLSVTATDLPLDLAVYTTRHNIYKVLGNNFELSQSLEKLHSIKKKNSFPESRFSELLD